MGQEIEKFFCLLLPRVGYWVLFPYGKNFTVTKVITCFQLNLKKEKGCITLLGSLSKDVFERRTSTGSEAFSLFIYLDSNKFVLLSFFSLIKRIYSRVSTKPLPNDSKSLLPVEVRRLKTLLLKLPIVFQTTLKCTSKFS